MKNRGYRSYNKESTSYQDGKKLEPETRKGVVANANLVNVRETPSINGKVFVVVHDGIEVEIVEEVDGGFYKIKLPSIDKELYISSKFCKEV